MSVVTWVYVTPKLERANASNLSKALRAINVGLCFDADYFFEFCCELVVSSVMLFICVVKCPSNDPDKMCSGHGVCKNMIELALQSVVVKPEEWVNTPEQQVIRYGTTNGTLGKTTWDAEVMRYESDAIVHAHKCLW